MEKPDIVSRAAESDGHYQDRAAEFEALTRQLADKELELASLERDLSTFEGRYAQAVGLLLAELDELDREIAREMLRLNPKEEYRQGFQRAERKAKASQETVRDKIAQGDKKPFEPSEELKSLFRKVAKTVHPDLATNEEERAYRNSLMARANEAYKKGDLEALKQILYEWEHRDERAFTRESQASPLERLEQQIYQVKMRLQEIDRKIAELKKSDLYELMVKVKRADQDGRDLLGDMALQLQEQIAAARKLLASLRERA